VVATALMAAGCGGGSSSSELAAKGDAAVAAAGLHVSAKRLLDSTGRIVRFHGVNRSGTEYACVQGWGIFDGPHDAASVKAIADWHVNAVRIPLNETCWLGINGVAPRYSGANYRRAIKDYVRLLRRHGIYAELSLMWAAPGGYRGTYQPAAPNADHSPAMWRGMARAFKRQPNVVLAPWGETIVNASCFEHGGVCEATFGPDDAPYRTAGMQQAVDVMRGAGYEGVIAIPGIDYANNLSHWLSHRPHDPRRQLIAEAHIYGKNVCSTPSCLDRTIGPVARRVPVIFGETGESYDDSSCGSDSISAFMRWADARDVGYLAWTWNTWGTCGSLIRTFAGAPNSEYGAWVRDHYAETRAAARLIPGR
jgi:hypothetical protein